jgi:hypothetical protein
MLLERVRNGTRASCVSSAASSSPDEMFFQTLVMNSPFSERVLGEQLPLHAVAGTRRAQSEGAGRGRLRAHRRLDAPTSAASSTAGASAALLARLRELHNAGAK